MTAAQKSTEAFRTISEAANELDVPQHVLRFWETKFSQIKPMKRGGGRRYYRPADIDLLKGIRKLLYEDGFTIKGVQKVLRERGVRFVMDAGTLSAQAQTAAAEIAAPSLVAQESLVAHEPVSQAPEAPIVVKQPEAEVIEVVTEEVITAEVVTEVTPAPVQKSPPQPAIPVATARPAMPPSASAAKLAPSVSKQLDMAVAAVMQGAPSPIMRPPAQQPAQPSTSQPEQNASAPLTAGNDVEGIADAAPLSESAHAEASDPSHGTSPEPGPVPNPEPIPAPTIDPGALKPSFAAAQGFVLSSTAQPTSTPASTNVQFSPDQSVMFKSIATPDNDDTADSPILEMAKDGVTDEQRRQLEQILIKLEGLKDEIDRTMASLAAEDDAGTPNADKRAQWQSRASNENRTGEPEAVPTADPQKQAGAG